MPKFPKFHRTDHSCLVMYIGDLQLPGKKTHCPDRASIVRAATKEDLSHKNFKIFKDGVFTSRDLDMKTNEE